MKSPKKKQTGLTDADRLMFDRFKDWYNLKGEGRFLYEDAGFQSFKNDNGITLDNESPIPNRIKEENAIFYISQRSAVGDLARHIRNAYSHSRIRRWNGYFTMTDIRPKRKDIPAQVTMRGKISVKLMQSLLDTIRKNKCDRNKKLAYKQDCR